MYRSGPSLASLCTLALGGLWIAAAARAGEPPIIAQIVPEAPGPSPHILTGEHFDPASTQVWVWEPPSDPAEVREAATRLGTAPPALPERPPEGARRVRPLDVETQVITAPLAGAVAWVETADGLSPPYLFHIAKPLWISVESAEPGDLVHVFGFGLRAQYRRSQLALRSETGTLFPRTIVEARALRTADPRLITFEVPPDAPPGAYEVWCHNSYGGAWGWRKAGSLEVIARPSVAARLYDVREFGARGDGLANDFRALEGAVNAAHDAGGGTVVFPPGVYATDRTLRVPPGVRLQGASRDASVLQRVGNLAHDTRVAWFHSLRPPTAVVRLGSDTGLHSLTVQGVTWRGEGGYGLVEALSDDVVFPIGGEVRDVAVVDCRLRALDEDPGSHRPLYTNAFHAGPAARRVRLLQNEIHGSVSFGIGLTGQAVRTEIIDNRFHGGAVSDVGTIGGAFSESLIDANILTDTPGRIVLGMGRHNYLRFNEVHQAFRSTWENAEEIYLVHGGVEAPKTVSFATAGSSNTLVDHEQDWKPGFHRESTVLLISGRGFGQYRRVTDNTATTLTVAPPWNVAPDATTEYVVAPMFVENAFFANLNNTPCRLSLWLDCIANLVEMHRDDHSKGADLWGEDASRVDDDGIAHGLSKFFPAYYNQFVNGWMDGTALWLGTPGAHEHNAHVGYPSFGNFVVRNRIREPHTYRTGFDVNPRTAAGISVGGGRGRAGTSHTIVAGNFLASTYEGIRVAETARKTFILQNELDHVDEPILDAGALTVLQGNRRSGRGQDGDADPSLADARSPRDLPAWKPRAWTPGPLERLPPLFHDVLALKVLVSQPVYCYAIDVESEAREAECQQNLRELFERLKAYDAEHGGLPKAVFYPEDPSHGADSLRVVLGTEAEASLTCPTCGPDLRRFGLNYAFNEKLSGRKLADIEDPAETWLLMDFVGAHDWMVQHGYCGHRRGVNVLYADGSVRWSPPFSSNPNDRDSGPSWLQWASRQAPSATTTQPGGAR